MEDGSTETRSLRSVPVATGTENQGDEMARKIIFTAAITAALIAPTQAGEVKFHEWPVAFVPQEVAAIPVLMDVGYYILIRDQDKLRIRLKQTTIKDYEGCTDMVIISNFDLTLSCSISSTGKVPGDYSCSVSPANIDSPGGTSTVCAKVANANLTQIPGGTKDVHVANVTIKVVPRFY
jgi:hypothetical protein